MPFYASGCRAMTQPTRRPFVQEAIYTVSPIDIPGDRARRKKLLAKED